MNDDFRTIYRILKILEASLDYEAVDMERISPDALGISKTRRDNLLAMMAEERLVKGVVIREYKDAAGRTILINPARLSITLKGAVFFKGNSMMKKAAAAAKGIADIIP